MYNKYSRGNAPVCKYFLMRTMKICFISLMTFLIVMPGNAQNPAQVALLQQFDVYRQTVAQEKIFLHTDKNLYLAGEICRFKIYCVDAYFHKPLAISKVVYTELLDKKNKSVLQAKIAMNKDGGSGTLFLPVSISSGKYKLRAYTNLMKNFGPDYFFEKTVTVINPRSISDGDTLLQKEVFTVTFFPEGGNLVNGIQSKVAFLAANQNGKGLDCSGVIVDDKSDTIVKFTAFKFGIGTFLFTPEPGRTYKAVIALPDGKKNTQELPAAYNYGYVMQLSETDNNFIKVTVKGPANNSPSASIYLFAHTRTSVKSVQNGKIQNGNAEFLIDKNKLGDGISHFTVFNSEKQPVCERLYFKYPEQKLEIGLTADAKEYDQRRKISININAADRDKNPSAANLSMAVYRLDSLQRVEEMDINNYLWLSSDLAGTVESPEYYFSGDSADAKSAVDNLMLTHGWRRFRWEDILGNKKPAFEFIPEYAGHIVTGKIIKKNSRLPEKNIGAYLSVPGTRLQFKTSVSDSSGNIKFEMKDFYNEGEIIVQTNNQLDSGYTVEVRNPFADNYSIKSLPEFSLSKVNEQALQSLNAGMQVQNTYSGNKIRQVRLPAVDTNTFFVKPDFAYLPDNYVRFTTMEEVLREYVMPVMVRKKNGKFHLPILDIQHKEPFEQDPMLLLDGVPVFDMDKFMSYDPLKVRKLEVVSKMYYFGNMFFPGIVNFVTYSGDLPGYELDPHATVIDYEGLQLQRDFFSPVYETKEQYKSRLPDFRNLLYWSPALKTDTKGTGTISFYSSDLPGKYAVVVQGLTADGKTGSKVIQFEVKEPEGVANK
jgi:hypothetical protein